jgi:formate hydrogenlyase transcriptional activator
MECVFNPYNMKNKSLNSSLKHKRPDELLELEKLIVEFSAGFANTPVPEIDGKIDQALKQIVECIGLDRCSFWEVAGEGIEVIMSHHYAVPGLDDSFKNIVYKDFPWVFQKGLAGNYVCFNSLEDLPEEAAIDKESFRLIGAKSSLIIPYHIAGKPIALMTFANVKKERKFSTGLITRLELIGEIITGAIYRKKMEERYEKSVREAQKSDKQIPPGDVPLRQETKNECSYEGITGNSPEMKLVFSRMEQVAPTDSVVLLLGETGTGKGVIARAIHELSSRKEKKIVTVNCAALTPNLIESELFGREKGAYTGSTEMQIGRFELADKGTLILDEITELPLDLQAKLLRAIQEGEFERLGSPRTIKVDARILALTSRNLKEEVSKGRFRRDLYYRINVFPITMPPLRERREDIPLLADYFVTQFNRKMQKEITTIPNNTMAELLQYSWPGNVRELEHIIERAVITTKGASLHLAEKLEDSGPNISEENIITNLAEVEKRHIIKILEKVNWRIDGSKGAAILLGLHPNTLRGRMQKLGIHLQKNS